jgi:UV DNA damage endonuclease
MSNNKPIQLGLCCLNTQLRGQKPPIFASRKMIIRTIEEKGINCLKEKIIQNLQDVLVMMDWNEENGIKVFRLSSELFPHKSNPKVIDYEYDFAMDLLVKIGEKSKLYNQRLTFHPGQYNVIGSPNLNTFNQTCIDLKYHADVLDLMNLDENAIMVIHGGGVYGNKDETIKRWIKQYFLLPSNVKNRLVLENCEKSYSIIDCLEISSKTGIPVVFDTHHFECYKQLHPEEKFLEPSEYIPDILNSWKNKNIKPKFHVSEQGSGKIGHHSDFIENIPTYLLEIPEKYNINIDIMIEAKMKEQAIEYLYNKYPFLNCKIIENTFISSDLNKPGIGWVNKNCKDCDCCDPPKKKKKKLIIKSSLSA